MSLPKNRKSTLPLLIYLLVLSGYARRICHRLGLEKRKYPRCKISLRVTKVETGSFSFYHALNISKGGIFLKSLEPLPKGTELRLRFSLFPDEDEIEILGVVMWIQEQTAANSRVPGMGVEFTSVDREARRTIKEFMDKTL